jgi:hypothetical protein
VSFICDSAYCWSFKSIISSINPIRDCAVINFSFCQAATGESAA